MFMKWQCLWKADVYEIPMFIKCRCLWNTDVYEMVMFMNVVVWLYEWVKEEQNLWYKQPNVNTH